MLTNIAIPPPATVRANPQHKSIRYVNKSDWMAGARYVKWTEPGAGARYVKWARGSWARLVMSSGHYVKSARVDRRRLVLLYLTYVSAVAPFSLVGS